MGHTLLLRAKCTVSKARSTGYIASTRADCIPVDIASFVYVFLLFTGIGLQASPIHSRLVVFTRYLAPTILSLVRGYAVLYGCASMLTHRYPYCACA